MRVTWAVASAVVAGALLAVAFPSEGQWWLAIPAVALYLAALRGRSIAGAALVGFVMGECFYLGLIEWITLFLGPLPWYALATLQSLWFVLGAIATTLAYRWGGSAAWVPPLVASLWTAREMVASHFPYRGFAWGRLGQSQSNGPFADLVAWVGVTGLGWVMVMLAAWLLHVPAWWRKRSWRPLVSLACAVAALALIPVFPLADQGAATIAGIQGGTEKAGFFAAGKPGEVLGAHLEASAGLTQAAQGRRLDLIVWPEGAAQPDPGVDAATRRALTDLGEKHQAPVLVGTIRDAGSLTYNTAQVWEKGTQTAAFDKRDPVPFGEYVPDRHLWERFAPEQIGMITREYTPGTTSPVVRAGRLTLGVGICFDVVDDALMRESAAADVLIYPTNNADFGRTDELDQQASFARLRAIESGRSVVQVSTVGSTVAYDARGRELARLPWYTKAAMVVEVPLTRGTTPAMLLAWPLEIAASVLGLVGLTALGIRRRRM